MTVHDDERRWFAAHPDRNYRCRVATSAEVETVRSMGWFDNGQRLADGCFVHLPLAYRPHAWRYSSHAGYHGTTRARRSRMPGGMVRGGPAERAH
jgi:hypothetical protein